VPVRVVWIGKADAYREGSVLAGVELMTGVGAQVDAA
jgi:hypothetical protein